MKHTHLSVRTLNSLGIGVAGAWVLVALGCGGHVRDETRLTDLSSSEREELCDEIQDHLPAADETFSCDDGYTVSFSDAGICGAPAAETCAASAGDVRACVDALVSDPCGAADAWPAACAPLEAAGCGSIVGAVREECQALATSDITPVLGVYELVSHTRNDTSCEAEGASVLGNDTQGLFVVVDAQVFGVPVAALQSCEDAGDCERLVATIREASTHPTPSAVAPGMRIPERTDLFMCQAEAPGSLLGGGYSVGSAVEGQCSLTTTALVLSRAADGSLQAEGRSHAWTTPAEQDECSYGGGRPPEDVPCTTLEVYEGRFLSAL